MTVGPDVPPPRGVDLRATDAELSAVSSNQPADVQLLMTHQLAVERALSSDVPFGLELLEILLLVLLGMNERGLQETHPGLSDS